MTDHHRHHLIEGFELYVGHRRISEVDKILRREVASKVQLPNAV